MGSFSEFLADGDLAAFHAQSISDVRPLWRCELTFISPRRSRRARLGLFVSRLDGHLNVGRRRYRNESSHRGLPRATQPTLDVPPYLRTADRQGSRPSRQELGGEHQDVSRASVGGALTEAAPQLMHVAGLSSTSQPGSIAAPYRRTAAPCSRPCATRTRGSSTPRASRSASAAAAPARARARRCRGLESRVRGSGHDRMIGCGHATTLSARILFVTGASVPLVVQ